MGQGSQVGGGGVRVDVNREVKLLRQFILFWGGGGVGSGVRLGGQGGCERRSEAFVKIQKKKKKLGGGGGVDVNGEVKFL